jgi:cytochrome P450
VKIVFGDLRTEVLYLPLWRKLPLPRSRRWNRAVETLNRTIRLMIAERRTSNVQRNDLLGMLLAERDEHGSIMSDQQVHDEVLTMFLAGHETSALTLTWALFLLAKHPEIQERAAQEAFLITTGLGLLPEDYEKLVYIRAVVQETVRLYPPVWSLGRSTRRDTTIGGLTVRRGTHV